MSLWAVVVACSSRSNKQSISMQFNILTIQQTEYNHNCAFPRIPSVHHDRADGLRYANSSGDNKPTISMNNKLLAPIYQSDNHVNKATKVISNKKIISQDIQSKIYTVIKLSLASLMMLLLCFTVVQLWNLQRDIGVLTSCMQFPLAFRGSYLFQQGGGNRKVPVTHRLVKMRNKC